MGQPTSLAIEGVRLVTLSVHDDERGSFTELWRSEWFPGAPQMVQSNRSNSSAGVLRGFHYHLRQADYWVPLVGSMTVGLYDFRRGSPTEGSAIALHLSADQPAGLYIPPGVLHGFYAESELVLTYLVDHYYDADDELGVAWDDPDVSLDWPAGSPILSDRDRENPMLCQVPESKRPTYQGN